MMEKDISSLQVQVIHSFCYDCSSSFPDPESFKSHRNCTGRKLSSSANKRKSSDGSRNSKRKIAKVQNENENCVNAEDCKSLQSPKRTRQKRFSLKELRDYMYCIKCYATFYKLPELVKHFKNCQKRRNSTFQEYRRYQEQHENSDDQQSIKQNRGSYKINSKRKNQVPIILSVASLEPHTTISTSPSTNDDTSSNPEESTFTPSTCTVASVILPEFQTTKNNHIESTAETELKYCPPDSPVTLNSPLCQDDQEDNSFQLEDEVEVDPLLLPSENVQDDTEIDSPQISDEAEDNHGRIKEENEASSSSSSRINKKENYKNDKEVQKKVGGQEDSFFSFICPVCSRGFNARAKLRQHLVIHREKTFHCQFCKYKAVNKKCMYSHFKYRHPEHPRYRCYADYPTCKAGFVSSLELKAHMDCHHSGLSLPSGKVLDYNEMLSSLSLDKSRINNIQVKNQGKDKDDRIKENKTKLKTPSKTLAHTTAVGQKEKKKDKKVQKEGGSQKDVDVDPLSFICPVCSRGFDAKAKLRQHLVIHREKTLYCQFCQYKAGYKKNMYNHFKSRHPEHPPYRCYADYPTCKAGFINSLELKAHVFSHSLLDSPLSSVKEQDDNNKADGSGPSEEAPGNNNNNPNNIQAIDEEAEKDDKIKQEDEEAPETSTTPYYRKRRKKPRVGKKDDKKDKKVQKPGDGQEEVDPFSFICSMCSRTFDTKIKLYRHELFRHREKSYQCEFCAYKGLFKKNMYIHFKARHPEHPPYRCYVNYPTCKEAFVTFLELRAHIASHKPKVYRCLDESCNRTFVARYRRDDHMNYHKNLEPYVCFHCGKRFVMKERLNAHMIVHKKRSLKCKFEGCGKFFTTITYLKSHAKSHLDFREFVCKVPECGASYALEKSLRHHMKYLHSESDPMLCPVCAYTTHQKSTFDKHMLIHTEEKNIKCDFEGCGMMFRQQSAKKRHAFIHQAPAFPCRHPGCDKSFTARSSRLRHEQIHLEIKPYKCKFCEKDFPDNRPLKKHVMLDHVEDEEFDIKVPSTYQAPRKGTLRPYSIKYPVASSQNKNPVQTEAEVEAESENNSSSNSSTKLTTN